jgi:hypothetical protein
MGWEGADWIHLAQEEGQWRVLATTVMNLHVPYNAKISWTDEQILVAAMYHHHHLVLHSLHY